MICITRILAFQDKWQRLDMASDILLHAAQHVRKRWECFHIHDVLQGKDSRAFPAYSCDMATANNLLVLSREVLYEGTAKRVTLLDESWL